MRSLKRILTNLYGFYAAVVCVACVFITGVFILLTPGLTNRRRVTRWGLRTTFLFAGMPFRVDGLDKLPKEPSVALANHRSYLDGLVLIAALPVCFTPVIKAEVSRVPVVALILRRLGARYVQREPAIRAGRDTKRLLDALKSGESLAIFPEGTFSVDDGLLPFSAGAFFMAAKAGVPVVPVTIQGTRHVLPLDRVLPRPAAVAVRVFEALRPDGSSRDAADALRDRTEAALSHDLKPDAPRPPGPAPDYAYYRRVFGDRPLPFAYLDLDLLEHNIRTLLDRSGGKRLRVDARTLRCPAVIDRVLRSDIRFHGVKCATASEAIYLAQEWELEDMLVAYPTLQREAIERVCRAVHDGCEITLTVDSLSHLKCLANAADSAGVTLPVCVEMDMSLNRPGLEGASHRSPVRTDNELLALMEALDEREHLRFRGLLAFDTQRSNIPAWFATPRGRRWLIRKMSPDAQRRLHQRRHEVLERLTARGYTADLVNGGGAGGVEFNAADPSITEISVGSALFAPEFGGDQDFAHAPAAGYAAEVMRRPGDDIYACLGGGYTAADTLDSAALPRPYLPQGAVLDNLESAGEAQIPIRYSGDLRVGDALFMRPPNAGELCERFSQLLLIQDGAIVDSAATYRALGGRLL